MRYEVNYNQLGIVEFNKNNPGKELDFIDGILLMQIYNLISEWRQIEKRNFNGEVLYWITYQKILDELPTIGLKTTDAIYRRLKVLASKDYGLIEKKTFQTGYENRKTYFRLTPLGLKTLTLRMDIPNPSGLKTVTPTDGKPYNKNTINKNTKDERESTLFDFLKNNYPNEIDNLKQVYKLPPDQWKFLIDDFNQRGYSKKTVTVTTFKKLLIGYKRIEDKKDNDVRVKQPYQRAIS